MNAWSILRLAGKPCSYAERCRRLPVVPGTPYARAQCAARATYVDTCNV